MSNGLLFIAGLIALALAALFAVPYFVDWNGYRGVFEEEATRILGREVRVGGDVNVRLLPAPYVRFEKLRIADTDGTGEAFFRAESFTMRLSIPPLLKGIVEANEIELNRPELRLAFDAEGGGNWRMFSITPGTLPFVPKDVSLQSVRIKDGVVALQGPKGTGVAQLEGLNGELKAESIVGPFAFKGTAQWQGADREIRVATDAMDAQGTIRFKTVVRGTGQSNTYTVDGRVFDLKSQPRFDGEIAARIELDAAQLPPGAQAAAPPAPEPPAAQEPPTPMPALAPTAPAADANGILNPSGKDEGPPVLDFKAKLAGDARGLRLDDITLSFERLGQPQLITGTASANWAAALSVELSLASTWLDLDRIAASRNGGAPFDTARNFVMAVMQALPETAETNVKFGLDQANLGGEPVSAVRIEVARSNGALLVKDLRAGLPGGAKLTLDGTVVAGDPTAQAFQGKLALRGTSLTRFLTWAAKDQDLAGSVHSDGPFLLQGELGLSDKTIALTEAGAEISGMPLTGEVRYTRGERPLLAVVLEGQEVDGARLWPAAARHLEGLLVAHDAPASESGAAAEPDAKHWLDIGATDLNVRLRAGKLDTGRQALRDVDVDVVIARGQLAMRSCRFVTDAGLSFELEGDIADAAGKPRGALRWIFAAPTSEAYTAFLQLLELSPAAAEQVAAYAALAPMRLAGSVVLGKRSETASDIAIDGSVQGGRLIASARLDGGFKSWRDAAANLALSIESPDVVQTLGTLAGRAPAGGEPRQRAGEIFFKAVGAPASGLLASASIKAPGLFLAYDGRVDLPPDGSRKFDGNMRVSARELGDVMAVAGLGSGGALRGTPIIGTIKVASAENAIELKPHQLSISGSKIDGTIALAYPKSGPAIVTTQLQVDKATIPGLLSVVLNGAGPAVSVEAPAEPAAEPLTAGKSIWPESAFDFAALAGIEGKLNIAFDTLSLDEGMAIKNARLDAAIGPDKIAVTRLEGSVLGGNVLSVLALDRAPGGANLAGDVRLTDVQLVAAGPEKSKAETAQLTLEFSSRASTPGGLIAAATGKGELTLGDMALRVPTPLALVATSEAVLTGQAGGSGEELTAALRAQIASSEVKVGPRKIAVDIADGAAKLAPFDLPSPAGATKVTTTIDLASLVVDSSWLLEPKAPDAPAPGQTPRGALPSVNVLYVGPLRDAWMLEPRITADGLERELSIRKMELDAEQLERLHRMDVERARQEDERRRALEADQPQTAAPPPAPPPAASQVVPNAAPQAAPAAPPATSGSVDTTGTWTAEPTPAAVPPKLPDEVSGSAAAGTVVPGDVVPTVPGEVVPAVPGLEAQATDPQAVDPAAAGLPPDAAAAAAAAAAAQRPRRARKSDPVGDQVLRSLQNSTN